MNDQILLFSFWLVFLEAKDIMSVNFMFSIPFRMEIRYNITRKERFQKMVILHIRNFGDIKIELDRDNAPISCANFVSLVKSGFYDGLTFHRVIKGFMIQGGDPAGNGTGGPGYSIKGEFLKNGVENNLSHRRGTVSMARAMDPNSAGSQFFICDNNKDKFLDGDYAAFGKVVKGMDVVDKIASSKTNQLDFPMPAVYIDKAEAIDEPDVEFEKLA